MEEINDDLIKLINEFNKKYSRLKQGLPYHLNVIDELHVNENANSRILASLLLYKTNGDYPLLKSFIEYCLSNWDIEITQPHVTSEKMRIDLLVRERGKYAIIFENKIYEAILQKNQIARYIQKLRQEEFEDEQIFVVFLPPYKYEPDMCSWHEPEKCCESCDRSICLKNKDPELKEVFKTRFKIVTFREDIISWLKEEVLPNCKQKEVYLYTATMQYLDYLEGYFDKRNINTIMNMELNQFLEEKLKINGEVSAEKKLEILTEKEEETQKLLYYINKKKEEINNTIIINKWGGLTEEKFKSIAEEVVKILSEEGFQIESKTSYNQETSELWIQFYQKGWDLSIIIAKKEHPDHSAFIYIGKPFEPDVDEKYYSGQNVSIFKYKSAAEKPSHPYGWEWIDNYHYKPITFYNAVMDGSFNEYLKEKVSDILRKIKEYNLYMS